MGLLKKPKSQTVMASAPEEDETEEEIRHIEDLNESKEIKNIKKESTAPEGYPVCMSQTQINNIIIENNYLLKHIISKIEED